VSITSSLKFSIPVILVVLAIGLGQLAAALSGDVFLAVHAPLELVVLISLVASVIVVVRLFPQRADPALRVPLVLNALLLTAVIIVIALGVSGVIR
jgi:hypothetical protein